MNYIVFGLGAIGSNLLMQLIQIEKEGYFTGVDYDKVEDRNIATQAYFSQHVGQPKAKAIRVLLNLKRRKVYYYPVTRKIDNVDDDILKFKNKDDCVLIDCFDNMQSRKLLERIDNCLHVGFSPQYTAEIIWGNEYTSPKDISEDQDDICEMSQAVPFIHFVVSMTIFSIQEYVETRNKQNFIITNKYKIRKL